MSELARALLEDLAGDALALGRLRELLGVDVPPVPTTATVFTVRSLAAELGRSERSIRDAIARGELEAERRGRGYVITVESVLAWATPAQSAAQPRRPRPRRSRPPNHGPMRRALGGR